LLPSEPANVPDLGVRLAADGGIQAAYRPCSPAFAQVAEVSLYKSVGKIGREDDEVLWRLSASPPAAVHDLEVGRLIPGFRTTVPLGPLPDSGLVLVLRSSDGSSTTVAFSLSDLRRNDYLVITTKKSYVTEDSFNRLSHCD
jgi:hypothetical protein